MKKIMTVFLALCMVFGLTACSAPVTEEPVKKHVIGVTVYDTADSQVLAFRHYLQDYIGSCYEDVEFLYSDSLMSPEAEMEFLQAACDAGAEAILSCMSFDLQKEVEFCADHKVYYMRASSTVADAEYEKVADNPYFLGGIGLGDEKEYQAGVDTAEHFIQEHEGGSYLILSGGAGMGNNMHILRTKGILDTLENKYGSFGISTEELAASPASVGAVAGDCNVCVFPGYLAMDGVKDQILEMIKSGNYDTLLTVIAGEDLANDAADAGMKLGMIDCYTESNQLLFDNGKLDFVAGKFGSIIGPSFIVTYNAINGYAEDFRDNGRAFRLEQDYWTSGDRDDYAEKYTYSSGVAVNAFSHEDLNKVNKLVNPDATFEEFKELAEACSFEDVVARAAIK